MIKISPEIKVCLQLLESQKKNDPLSFLDLVKIFDGIMTKREICASLNVLDDLFLIKRDYVCKNGRSKQVIKLVDLAIPIFEDVEGKIQKIFDIYEENFS